MHAHESQTTARARRPRTPDRRSRRWVVVPIALGALALTAACDPYGGTSYGAPSSAGSSASAPLPEGAVVGAASTDLGTVLVDGQGLTVYHFANDTGSTSTCDGDCATTWLPVAAPDVLPAAPSGVTGELGSTQRTDGTSQLTVAGHPVYTFTGDSAPGQTNGEGLTLNGGLWTVVSPDGSPLT